MPVWHCLTTLLRFAAPINASRALCIFLHLSASQWCMYQNAFGGVLGLELDSIYCIGADGYY